MQEFLRLKKSNCKNCYKCIRHCPVKSIRFSGNQAHIVSDECVLCGNCFVICPQNAKEIKNDVEKAKVLLCSGAPVVASVAPSFIANYSGMDINDMQRALKKLGFTAAEETAIGATYVKNEYDRIMRSNSQQVCISSCCPSVNMLIRRYYPEALPYLARVMSPMQAHCADIRNRYKDAKTVFIGPCIAKKQEAEEYGDVDCVLTFEELTQWLESEGIALEHIDSPKDENSRARLFPTSGGILKTMLCDADDCSYMSVDGMENCQNTLRDISEGKLSKCFIEMSACYGSCIGGPAMDKAHRRPLRDYMAIDSAAGKKDFII
ncbi:MAG: [Fe-Fe] hydrogenase large subunit C-terminal domain-containing protein, partial [Firmicutes bacterium]|nr:[Fe-Fe] hydrogenase large subunit C-terminal domain-containing protein [Bacillota bacterium]